MAAALYWSGIDWCSRSMMSALPPTATTASLRINAIRSPRLISQRTRQRRQCLAEAGKRRVRNARADLTDARLPMRDAGVDDRQDAGVDDLARVDARGRTAEIQRRQR